MHITGVDLQIVEKELQAKIKAFELFSKEFSVTETSANMFQEMVIVLKSLYSTMLQIKSSHFLLHGNKYSSSSILSLTDVEADFINNIQLVSEKLRTPANEIINLLMKEVAINSTINSSNLSFSVDYKHIIRQLLIKKLEIVLSGKDFLEVTKSDLSDPGIIYSFAGIEILIFKGIEVKDFQDSIGTIEGCKTVFISNSIPKLVIYSKTKNIQSLKIYKSLDDVYDAIFIFK